MAYEELSEPWYPPKIGDWVTDKKGNVCLVIGLSSDGKKMLCQRKIKDGRKRKDAKDILTLTKIDDAVAKILTSVNKEN